MSKKPQSVDEALDNQWPEQEIHDLDTAVQLLAEVRPATRGEVLDAIERLVVLHVLEPCTWAPSASNGSRGHALRWKRRSEFDRRRAVADAKIVAALRAACAYNTFTYSASGNSFTFTREGLRALLRSCARGDRNPEQDTFDDMLFERIQA